MSEKDLYDDLFYDEESVKMHDFCPHCGRGYDEIDYEYQICNRCKRSAETPVNNQSQTI